MDRLVKWKHLRQMPWGKKKAKAEMALERLIEVQQNLWTELIRLRSGKSATSGELTPQERENKLFDLVETLVERSDDDEKTYKCLLCMDLKQIWRVLDNGIMYSRPCSCLQLAIQAKREGEKAATKIDFGPPPPEEDDDAGERGLFD